MRKANKLPTWFLALTTIYFVSNLFVFGGLALFFPHLAFPDADASAVFPIQFFAIRHIAFAFPLLYGLMNKDIKVLLVCYSMFLVMTVLDVTFLFVYGYDIPVIGKLPFAGKVTLSIGGFIGPVVLSLWTLVRHSSLSSSPTKNISPSTPALLEQAQVR